MVQLRMALVPPIGGRRRAAGVQNRRQHVGPHVLELEGEVRAAWAHLQGCACFGAGQLGAQPAPRQNRALPDMC